MRGATAWARAELRGRWRGHLTVAVLIGLLAAAVLTALAGARRTDSSYDRLRRATKAHDVLAFSPDGDQLARIARLPEVAAAWVARGYPTFIDLESEFDITILAGPGNQFGRTVDVGRYLSGRPPRPDRADEVALNPQAAAQLHARVGQIVNLQTLSPDQVAHIEESFSGQAEGPRLRLRVTGVVRNADDLQGQSASALLFATPAFHRTYADAVGSFAWLAGYRLRGGAAGHAAFAGEARPLLGTEGEVSLTSVADVDQAVDDSLHVLVVGMLAIGLAGLLVAAVVGGQALGRQLWLGAPDQAVLGALGLRRRDRAVASTLVAVPVAIAAALVATVGSVLASPLTPVNIGRQAEPDPGVRADLLVHGLGAAAVAVFVLAVAGAVGWRLAGHRAVGATAPMRPTFATRLTRGLRLHPTAEAGVRMALERGRGRSTAPVGTALLASVVAVIGLAGALTFASSLDRLTASPARFGYGWDLQPDIGPDDVGRLARQPDVAAVGTMGWAEVVVDGAGATGYALQAHKQRLHFSVIDGREPRTRGEVAVGADLQQRLHKHRGAAVTFATGERQRRLRIVGTVVTPSQDQDPLAGGVVLTLGDLREVAQSDVVQQTVLTWRGGVDVPAAERRLRRQFPLAISAYSHPRLPGEVANLDRVRSLPVAFGAFLVAVGVAALLHALLTSARRRRQDLAVLRTLGFVRRQVAAALGWQASTIAVIGLVFGLPLGVAAGRWIWVVVAGGIGVATDPRVPLAAGAPVLAAALVLANLVGWPLGLRAGRVAPADVLRAE